MNLAAKLLTLLTTLVVVGMFMGCTASNESQDSPASRIATLPRATITPSQPSVAVSATNPEQSERLTSATPNTDTQQGPGSQIPSSPAGDKPGTQPVHTPFPSNKVAVRDTGKQLDNTRKLSPKNTPARLPVGDLPHKPKAHMGPPIPDLPLLISPVERSSESWEPIKLDGHFSSLGAVTAHDADVLELSDGTYRAYYAVEDRNIMSSASQDGLRWIQDTGVRISNVAFPNAVLLNNGDVRLFYQDGMSIGSSISSDGGITFKKEHGLRVSVGPINGINLDNLGAPSTIRLSDGRYRMYFRGGVEDSTFWNGQQSYVFSASSSDALDFSVDPGVRMDPSQFSDGGTGAPPGYGRDKIHWVDGNDATVEPNGSVQLYFFSGFCFGLCMATSEDGLEFNNYQQVMSELVTPMNELTGGTGRSPGDPSILRTSTGERMMYFGQGGHDVEPREFWGVYIAGIKH